MSICRNLTNHNWFVTIVVIFTFISYLKYKLRFPHTLMHLISQKHFITCIVQEFLIVRQISISNIFLFLCILELASFVKMFDFHFVNANPDNQICQIKISKKNCNDSSLLSFFKSKIQLTCCTMLRPGRSGYRQVWEPSVVKICKFIFGWREYSGASLGLVLRVLSPTPLWLFNSSSVWQNNGMEISCWCRRCW